MVRRFGLVILALSLIGSASAQQEPPRYWDFNGDGKEDVRYEGVAGDLSYVQHLDRNFDGKDDYNTQFDSNSDWPVGGFSDDDFDGTFETRHIYKNASIFATVTDSNGDGYYDIAHYYEAEMVSKSLKYSIDDGEPNLITAAYKFDFPISSSRTETTQTPSHFHESLKSTMPQSQNMPLKPSN